LLVSCRICKTKNERDSSYKVVVNGKNQYYCSEKEYLDDLADKKARADVFKFCVDILGNTTNTILFKEMSIISSVHKYSKISAYLSENISNIKGFMNRSFDSEYGKIRYFTTILKNNLGDFIFETKEEKVVPVEIVEVNYKPRNRKKSLNQYIDEYEVNQNE
jgi:hypothetical protein